MAESEQTEPLVMVPHIHAQMTCPLWASKSCIDGVHVCQDFRRRGFFVSFVGVICQLIVF